MRNAGQTQRNLLTSTRSRHAALAAGAAVAVGVLLYVGWALTWGSGGGSRMDAAGLDPRVHHEVVIQARVTSDSEVVDPDRIYNLRVQWRGLPVTLFKRPGASNEWALEGRQNVTAGWFAENPPETTAIVSLSGSGIYEIRSRAFEGRVVTDRLFRLEIAVQRPSEVLPLVYLDDMDEPIAEAQLRVVVQYRGGPILDARDVVTDRYGRANIRNVAYPLSAWVNSQQGLAETDWLFVPDEYRSADVFQYPRIHPVIMRRMPRRSHWVSFEPAGVTEMIAASAQRGEIMFMLAPLTEIDTPLRRVWSRMAHSLSGDAVDRLATEGRIWLGGLPESNYWLTLFSPDLGLYSANVGNPRDWPGGQLAVDVGGSSSALEATLVDKEGQPSVGSLVLHGYVPHIALARIVEILKDAALAGRADGSRMHAMTGPDGTFSLTGQPGVGVVTVLTKERHVYHIPVPSGQGHMILDDSHEDAVLEVKVVCTDGHPLAGVAVNLTSLDVSGDDSWMPWPLLDELTNWWSTDAGGTVRIRGLLPMTYVLSVSHEQRTGNRRTFAIDGQSVRVMDVERGSNEVKIVVSPAMVGACEECDDPCHDHGAHRSHRGEDDTRSRSHDDPMRGD